MSFFTALSGLNAARAEISSTSNNIANVGTVGFHGSRAEFSDLYSSSLYADPDTIIGSGTSVSRIARSFEQGTLVSTSNALDLAIDGPGFFRLQPDLAGGTPVYSRAGAFSLDKDGYVRNGSGAYLTAFPTDPTGAVTGGGATTPLQIPPMQGTERLSGAVEVDDKGVVWAAYGSNDAIALGRLSLATFPNMQGLKPLGDASYAPSGESGPADLGSPSDQGMGAIRAGTLEQANVDLTKELVNLITAQRNYQASAKALETNSQVSQTIMNMRS